MVNQRFHHFLFNASNNGQLSMAGCLYGSETKYEKANNTMNKRKKIAIDARELAKDNLGSLGLILLELAARLENYELFLFSDIDIPAHRIPQNANVIVRGVEYTGGFDLFKFQRWMKQKLVNTRVDCFFQINHFSLMKTKGIQQIVVIHDLYALENIEHHSIKEKIIYRLSMLATLFNADTIFTVSEFTKKRLEHYFWRSNKVEVNYNGVNHPPVITDLDAYRCVDGPFFLMLGRVNYYKGTIRVTDLYHKYLSDSGYKLIIAGQAKTNDVISEMKLYTQNNTNIVWLDYIDEPTKEWLLQNCSLFLYAARYDGFGIPPLEAAIRRKKVLMNDIDILREVSKNNGVYVNYESDDQEVVDAILKAAADDNREKIEVMYNTAASYTWDKFTAKVVSTIEES